LVDGAAAEKSAAVFIMAADRSRASLSAPVWSMLYNLQLYSDETGPESANPALFTTIRFRKVNINPKCCKKYNI
jgi:hypothetical protein